MEDSILKSVKKVLNVSPDDTAFDEDIIMHINSTFGILNQLGLGPEEGFQIEDDTAVWDDFLAGDKRLSAVKTDVFLRVRILFDPPQLSFVLQAMQTQIAELEWRLNVVRENEISGTET